MDSLVLTLESGLSIILNSGVLEPEAQSTNSDIQLEVSNRRSSLGLNQCCPSKPLAPLVYRKVYIT